MSHNIQVLIREEDVRERIREMADVISARYEGREVLLIGILNGSVFFLTELAQKLSIPTEIDFMQASSYGNSTESSGNVVVTKDLDRSLRGKHVLVVEDIIDTGRTLKVLTKMLLEMEPESLEVVTLLDKPDRRVVEFEADYTGFRIPDVFVVGWGLDFDQKYRDLSFIGVLDESK